MSSTFGNAAVEEAIRSFDLASGVDIRNPWHAFRGLTFVRYLIEQFCHYGSDNRLDRAWIKAAPHVIEILGASKDRRIFATACTEAVTAILHTVRTDSEWFDRFIDDPSDRMHFFFDYASLLLNELENTMIEDRIKGFMLDNSRITRPMRRAN